MVQFILMSSFGRRNLKKKPVRSVKKTLKKDNMLMKIMIIMLKKNR